MIQTFVNLPPKISEAISSMLSLPENGRWIANAEKLHERYMTREKDTEASYIHDSLDVFAYLGLRSAATYAQIAGALLQVQEVMPSWQPISLLDIGCGPGTGVWAAKTLWPSIKTVTCLDQDKNFLTVGKQILEKSELDIHADWQQQNIANGLGNIPQMYDLVIIANVLNELEPAETELLINKTLTHCKGILVILEPGTPYGYKIIQNTAKKLSGKSTLIAPYINNSYIQSDDYWIHFPQRFIRPEFLRRIRQHMRDSELMASDWEEAKYSFVAVGKVLPEEKFWGRCIGPIKKQKGFLEVPILTKDKILYVKVLKRHKDQYAFAKELKWGQAIKISSNLLTPPSTV